MDLSSRLLMFLDVTERGSFAKVAEHRNIDRSVVSKQIARLEEELGVRLLNRTTRTFSLTGAGNETVRKARELRELLNETTRLAGHYHSEPKGVLRIACSASVAHQMIQPVINDFQNRFVDVQIELVVGDSFVDLVGDGFDLAFRVGDPKDSTLIARYLARNRLLLLATPSFIERYGEPKTVEELAKLPAASYMGERIRADYINYVDDQNQVMQMPMNSRYLANDIDMMKLKALSGTAYYLAPAFQIHDEITSGKLIPIMTDMKLLDFAAIYAVYPHRDLPVRTRLFFDAVKDYIGEDIPRWERNIPGFECMYGTPTRKEWLPE